MKLDSFHSFIYVVLFVLTITSCRQREFENYTSEFKLAPDHTIELVASEPSVILPVAMVEDSKNRFWVVEMPGYMRDIDGNDEGIPDGRIVILSDENGDGQIDKRKIFLDSLLNPRAICLVNDGLLYTDGTQLKWTETKGDQSHNSIVVDSFYVVGGNIEHQPNGLLYNMDNWIYSAKSNARYKYKKGKWLKEATTFRGQWGLTMDENGRLIYNHNSAPLIGDVVLPNQLLNNPYLEVNKSTGLILTDDMRIYPIQATTVNRGYLPDVLDSTGKVINYTSACAPHLYYGTALSSLFQKSAFVCAPEGNLIANYAYNDQSLSADRQLGVSEFLTSKEESFRPVNLHTGFDGCLYVVDMRKGIIQHTAYMSSYLRDNITQKGLDKINGKGRIYRVRKNDHLPSQRNLNTLNPNELISLLSEPNLQLRMFAQKELVHKNDPSTLEALHQLALTSDRPTAQIHSLWTMEGMGILTPKKIVDLGRSIRNPEVLFHLIALSKITENTGADYEKLYRKASNLQSTKLDFILASIVGKEHKYNDLWLKIANRYADDLQMAESLVSSCEGRERFFLKKLKDSENAVLKEVLNATLSNKLAGKLQSPQLIERPFDDDRTNGLKMYKAYCAACHNLDGKGQKNVAPSLKESSIIQGKESKIASIILNGYRSENSPYTIMMPAYKEDKNMSDQDVNDIISYLKSTYTNGWNSLKTEEITVLRSASNY